MTSVIEVTPVAPLPTALGVLEVSASRNQAVAVWDASGSCTSDLASTVAPYTFVLDPALAPWADAIDLALVLDGTHWSDVGDVIEQPSFVFARCEEPLPSQTDVHDAALGEHVLRMDGALRGLGLTVASNTETFSLQCMAPGGASCTAAPPRTTHTPVLASAVMFGVAMLVRRRRRA